MDPAYSTLGGVNERYVKVCLAALVVFGGILIASYFWNSDTIDRFFMRGNNTPWPMVGLWVSGVAVVCGALILWWRSK